VNVPSLLVRHDPAVRTVAVARTTRLTPGFVRVTVEGAELGGFASRGPTDHVKLSFSADDELSGTVTRDYTPRAFRPATADRLPQLDLDFYSHANGGPATRWAGSAVIEDPLTVRGPRASRLVPEGVRRVVLVADETALPAMARWIELLPDAVEILGIVELGNESDAAYLEPAHVNRARVVLLNKGNGALERSVRSIGELNEDTYVWAAGEATALIPIRRYLRRESALPAHRLKVDGYWKRGEAGRDHHAPIDPTDLED
jgi:NADPH-dependent ferric siderophore reductase